MSHYEERLEKDLGEIRRRVQVLSRGTVVSLEKAQRSLFTGDRALAYETILGDAWVNERTREIDGLCHRFIARHLPSGGHLRYVSAVIRTIIQLERLGDYAVTIAREGLLLTAPPEGAVARELVSTCEQANATLERSIEAFDERSEEKARAYIDQSDSMVGPLNAIYADLMETSEARRIKDLLALFVVFNMLKRVTDQAKNLCEEAIFAAAGETKQARVHGILFVDQDDARLAPMAKAIAERDYPGLARYASAGLEPAAAVDGGMKTFMGELGFDLSEARPKRLDPSPESLVKNFLIVSLEGSIDRYVKEVPFHTSVLEWDVAAPDEGAPGDPLGHGYERLYREISSGIREMMDLLRGEEAP